RSLAPPTVRLECEPPEPLEANRTHDPGWAAHAAGELVEHAAHANRGPHRREERQVPRDPALLRRHAVRDEKNARFRSLNALADRCIVLRRRRTGVCPGDEKRWDASHKRLARALGHARRGTEQEDRAADELKDGGDK